MEQKWWYIEGKGAKQTRRGGGKVAGSGSASPPPPAWGVEGGGMGTMRAGSLETIQASTSLWLPGSASSPNSTYYASQGPLLRQVRLCCAEQGSQTARVQGKGARDWGPDTLSSTSNELYSVGQSAFLWITFFLYKWDNTFYSVDYWEVINKVSTGCGT